MLLQDIRYKTWEESEEIFLVKFWGHLPPKEIGEKLGRTTQSINRKANRMSLRISDEQYEKNTGRIRWTKHRESYLIEHYNKKSISRIMKYLGATDCSAHLKVAGSKGNLQRPHLEVG